MVLVLSPIPSEVCIEKKKSPGLYFVWTFLVIHLLGRLSRTKEYQLRYEKWPRPRECHSGRLIILPFLKKISGKVLLLMNSIQEKSRAEEISG